MAFLFFSPPLATMRYQMEPNCSRMNELSLRLLFSDDSVQEYSTHVVLDAGVIYVAGTSPCSLAAEPCRMNDTGRTTECLGMV